MTDLRPIETTYAGCRFRSRLEARWAVFFDALAIPWHYEPQGWVAEGAPYLPDFWLPSQNVWYEVKGTEPLPGYRPRLEGLAVGTKRRLVLAIGDIPRPDTWSSTVPFRIEVCYPNGDWDDGHAWCRCPTCQAIDIQFDGLANRTCQCHTDRTTGGDDPDILNAYAAARSARFEREQVG